MATKNENADEALPIRRIVATPTKALPAIVGVLFCPDIVLATPVDIYGIISLAAPNAGAIGFLTTHNMLAYIRLKAIHVAWVGNDIVGYILSPRARRYPPARTLQNVWQIVVEKRYRQCGIGSHLLGHVEHEAQGRGVIGMSAHCAETLAAKDFWQSRSYSAIAHVKRENVRNRKIIYFRKPFVKKIPFWFLNPECGRDPHLSPPRKAICPSISLPKHSSQDTSRQSPNPSQAIE